MRQKAFHDWLTHSTNKVADQNPVIDPAPVIFISQSHADEALAHAISDLFLHAYHLRSDQIRCSGRPGFDPQVSSPFSETLRHEILGCKLFVWLATPNSVGSPYVLMEVGGRWAATGPLAPAVAGSVATEKPFGPIPQIQHLHLEDEIQVEKLVAEAATLIDREPEQPAALNSKIKAVVSAARNVGARQKRELWKRWFVRVVKATALAAIASFAGDYLDITKHVLPTRVDFADEKPERLKWSVDAQRTRLRLELGFVARSGNNGGLNFISVSGSLKPAREAACHSRPTGTRMLSAPLTAERSPPSAS